MENFDLLIERIKTLEKQRDELAAEKDSLLLQRDTILSVYTEWLIDNNFILYGGMKIDHVKQFKKSIDKLKKKFNNH